MRILLVVLLTSCSAPPGTLFARISSDAQSFTSDDGWALSFTHVVVALKSFAAGEGLTGMPAKAKLIDFGADPRVDLETNTMANTKTYDSISLTLGHTSTDENVNAPGDVVSRMGQFVIWLEGTAVKQSTTRRFELGVVGPLTFDACKPAVTVEPRGTATIDFRVHAQRAFIDDAGKMKLEEWALADTTPQDGLITNMEAAAAQLASKLDARAKSFVGLGDSGTCTGH